MGGAGAGKSERAAGRNGACGASPRPLDERRVSGVPSAPSIGGGAGLPDLPREARGRGVVSGAGFAGRGMGRYMARPRAHSN